MPRSRGRGASFKPEGRALRPALRALSLHGGTLAVHSRRHTLSASVHGPTAMLRMWNASSSTAPRDAGACPLSNAGRTAIDDGAETLACLLALRKGASVVNRHPRWALIVEDLMAGMSIRRVAVRQRASEVTVRRYRQMALALGIRKCKCGRDGGHNGRCAARRRKKTGKLTL